MSQNPNGGPNYNPYGPNPSNPNYPPTPGTAYGSPQPPAGPNPGYSPYANPPSGPNPYQNPPSGPGAGTPNSNYGPYGPTYAPPPPGSPPASMPQGPESAGGPYNPYDPTMQSQQASSGANYPPYTPPGMPPLPQSIQQPKTNNNRTVLIAVIALVVIVGGILGVVLFNNHQQAVQQANGTATALAKVTGTANAQFTATGVAQATATFFATHYPFSSNQVLSDPMTDDSHVGQYGWDENTSCTFSAGSYHALEATSQHFHLCVANTPTYGNFTFEVQMAIKSGGTTAQGGILFRADTNNDRFYVLFLDTQGNYELDIQANQSGTNTRTLRSGQVSGYASGFSQVHTIGAVARNSQIAIYIDQKQVTQVTDTTYNNGQIGVISSFGSSSTEVLYNNVKVWQLP
ncbi:MAG TPA: hypothetical protein VGF67_25495 [Ktedonobacteraceae bacterium]